MSKHRYKFPVLEILGVMVGVVLAEFAFAVWLELKKPDCSDGTPMLEGHYSMSWRCAILQDQRD